MKKATVRIPYMNKRADENTQRLLRWIEDFVNVGDDPASYNRFVVNHPSFSPVEGWDDSSWTPKAHKLFLAYRDCLRRIWRRENPSPYQVEVAYLLGMADSDTGDCPWFLREAWDALGGKR